MTAPESGKVIAVRQRIRHALDQLIQVAKGEGDKALADALVRAYQDVLALQQQAEGRHH